MNLNNISTQFDEQGFVLLEDFIPADQVDALNNEIDRISELDGQEFFRERSGAVRTIFSPESFSNQIKELIYDARLKEAVLSILGEPYYLFQSKYNNKQSLESGSWTWHQDFKFWKEDGMPQAKALTVAVYLTEVSNFSGPIIVVPGSHKHGEIPTTLNNPDGVHDEDLKYVITPQTLEEMVRQYGPIQSTTGRAGSILIFHSNILHGSYQNMFYVNRKILMFTFNPLSNKTNMPENPRPEAQVKRDLSII